MSNRIVRVGLTIMLIRHETILLGKRINTETALNTWAYPGGRMDYGETPIDGIIRETFEETGLIIDPKKVRFIGYQNEPFPDQKKHYVNLVHMCSDFKGEPELKEPDKCAEWNWFDPFDLPKDIFWAIPEFITNNKKLIRKIIAEGRKCWLCRKGKANTVVKTCCETPGGKPCKEKEVIVHWGCYMDMDG